MVLSGKYPAIDNLLQRWRSLVFLAEPVFENTNGRFPPIPQT